MREEQVPNEIESVFCSFSMHFRRFLLYIRLKVATRRMRCFPELVGLIKDEAVFISCIASINLRQDK